MGLQIALVLIALLFLTYQITRPLVDYDEAIYAKVIVDTVKSGDVLSFSIAGRPFLDKPPLGLWAIMASVEVFGAQEWAFRLPGILSSVVCLWMVYLLVLECTENKKAAVLAFLLLLFTPPFYFLAKEVRLDSGVLATILTALFLLVKGWKKEKFLFWILPVIAVGFLIKSVIVFLAVPILIIYSFAYNRWGWLRNRFFWIGSLLAVIVIAPWHILETLRFGNIFWNNYIGRQVFERATSTITGSNEYLFYIKQLWSDAPGWSWLYAAIIVLFIVFCTLRPAKPKISRREIAAPLCAALLILCIFSLASTRLSAYVMPMYPFFAMFIGILFHQLSPIIKREYLAAFALVLLVTGIYYTYSPKFTPTTDQYDEMRVGQAYLGNQGFSSGPLYSFDWWKLDTMNYYGDTSVIYLDPRNPTVKVLKAPFYFVTSLQDEKKIFYDNNGTPKSAYGDLEVGYQGKYLFLVYFDKDMDVDSLLRAVTPAM